MGQKGLTKIAEELTWQTMERALQALDKTVAGQTIQEQIATSTPPEFEFIEIQYYAS